MPTFAVALAGNLSLDKAAEILIQSGWKAAAEGVSGSERERFLRKNGAGLLLAQGRFGDILEASSVCIGLAGTANEQAVGLGKPVVAFPGPGSPIYQEVPSCPKAPAGGFPGSCRRPLGGGTSCPGDIGRWG